MGLNTSAPSNHMSWPAPGKHKLQHPETEADRQQLDVHISLCVCVLRQMSSPRGLTNF